VIALETRCRIYKLQASLTNLGLYAPRDRNDCGNTQRIYWKIRAILSGNRFVVIFVVNVVVNEKTRTKTFVEAIDDGFIKSHIGIEDVGIERRE
jgi:hypothetical protein